MVLSERKSKILKAVVNYYISTGEPVGSKNLLNLLDFSVSSATVRNEMAELADKGFLEQPHTSAGRIPSQKGYRYYIDNLLDHYPLNPRTTRAIDDALQNAADDPEHILSEASKILSQITGCVAISTTPPADSTRISRIRIVQTGRHTSMMIMITSTGMIKNRLFRCDYDINSEVIEVFEKALNEMLGGVLLSSITPAFIQTVAVSLGDLITFMPQLLMAVMDAAKEASVISIRLNGQTNLLMVQDFDLLSVRGIMRFLSSGKDIEKLLFKSKDNMVIMLGTESAVPEIAKTSVAVSRYYIDDRQAGSIAVMGPIRMDYDKILASLEYISKRSGKLISELLTG